MAYFGAYFLQIWAWGWSELFSDLSLARYVRAGIGVLAKI